MTNLIELEKKLFDVNIREYQLANIISEFLTLFYSNNKPNNDELSFFYKLIELTYNVNDLYEALRLSMIALDKYPDSPYIFYHVCNIYFKDKEFKKLLMIEELFFRSLSKNTFIKLESIKLDILKNEIGKKLLGVF